MQVALIDMALELEYTGSSEFLCLLQHKTLFIFTKAIKER